MSGKGDVKESAVDRAVEKIVRSSNGTVSPDAARREIAERARKINNERRGK